MGLLLICFFIKKGFFRLKSEIHYFYWIACIICMHTLQAVPGYDPKGFYVEGKQSKQKYRGYTYVHKG